MITNSKSPPKCWNIKLVQGARGDDMSRVFDIGKPVTLKKLKTSEYFRGLATHSKHPQATRGNIVKAGDTVLLHVLKGKASEMLDNLRFSRFHQKVASSSTQIQLCSLPLTSAAA